jgi:hypothetical protein
MTELKEQVAYLQGLADGLEISEESKEGKLLLAMLDVLSDIADEMADLSDAQEDLEDYVDAMDSDLTDLEDELLGEEDDECCHCDEDGEYVETTCPNCGEVVCFDADILDDDDLIEVVCPVCESVVFVNDGEGASADDSQEETAETEEEKE